MPILPYRVVRSRVFLVTAALLGLFVVVPSVHATTTISQGYTASTSIAVGSIVSLVDNTNDSVELASTSNINNLFGVVINTGSSILTLDNGSKTQVQVATSGVLPTLVSDCNGEISTGDPVTASPLQGVGMKATSNIKIVGIAQGKVTGATKQKVSKDICGSEEVVLGQVPILISVAYHYREPEKTLIPASLQNLANTIAGKSVSSLPIIISAAIFFVIIIVVVAIIYSLIRNSLISIGRNPMAQSAVYRDVIQLSALVLAILGVGVIAIY
ncbi:MAG: hypothetical protein ABIP74_03220, partial [Candidatus Saccharimonas sp.]